MKMLGLGESLAAELSNDVETTFSKCSILFACRMINVMEGREGMSARKS